MSAWTYTIRDRRVIDGSAIVEALQHAESDPSDPSDPSYEEQQNDPGGFTLGLFPILALTVAAILLASIVWITLAGGELSINNRHARVTITDGGTRWWGFDYSYLSPDVDPRTGQIIFKNVWHRPRWTHHDSRLLAQAAPAPSAAPAGGTWTCVTNAGPMLMVNCVASTNSEWVFSLGDGLTITNDAAFPNTTTNGWVIIGPLPNGTNAIGNTEFTVDYSELIDMYLLLKRAEEERAQRERQRMAITWL